MFSVRIQEVALPTSDRDLDSLVSWFTDSLSLVRKRGEEMADGGKANPVHRLLRDYIFAQPEIGWDAQMLADELALTPASLNHHLTRLVQAGIIGYTNEGKGWRRYYLRGGSITKAIELFQTLGLIDRVHHLPSQLSGGERSRVATIRAIINKPCVLFADEPTGNLDKKNSLKLIDLLGQINRDFSQSIVLTTHNPDVASIGDKQYKLENGSLIL